MLPQLFLVSTGCKSKVKINSDGGLNKVSIKLSPIRVMSSKEGAKEGIDVEEGSIDLDGLLLGFLSLEEA